jgi:hypothetical protein
MKLLIMQFSPTSCYFISLRPKYSPQHPVLKYPQSMFLLRLAWMWWSYSTQTPHGLSRRYYAMVR